MFFIMLNSCIYSIYSTHSLIDSLADESYSVRRKAARALGEKGPYAIESIPFLINALNDERPAVCIEAAVALAKIDNDGKKSTQPLIDKLQHENPMVRVFTIKALEKIALSESIDINTEKTIFNRLVKISKSGDDHYEFSAEETAINSVRKIQIKILKREAKINDSISTIVSTKIDNIPPKITLTSNDKKITSNFVMTKKNRFTVTGIAKDDSGVAEVKINNVEAALDAEGNFYADILLKIGSNRIHVLAMDIHKNKSIETFSINRFPTKTKKIIKSNNNDFINIKGKYYALIIGINNYKYLKKLETPVDDSIAIAEILEKYNFSTTLLIDTPSRKKIMREINKLRQLINEDDKLLIYYAGHGFFNSNTEKAYWLPIDAEPNDTTNWIIADTITSSIKNIPAKHILVVSDSCYSGTLTRKVAVDLSSDINRLNYISKMLKKNARVLIASGGSEPVLDNNGNGHSIFAEAFMNALKNIDKNIFTAEELFVNQIKETVAGNANQTPEYKLIRNSGHSGGDFVFIRKSKN